MIKVKPTKVIKIYCPTPGCGELMVKIYPWSSIGLKPNERYSSCNRCKNAGRPVKVAHVNS